MRSKAYRINIPPIPWQRTTRSPNRCYDNDAKERISFGLYLNQQHNEEPFFNKPLHLDVIFYMPFPKLIKNRDKSNYHSNIPHLDNLYKFLLHAMKDVLISDDRVICSLSLKKVYDNEPRTELIITEVE
jgi:Holliday junction resolvase RusA-like endonuclease